MKERKLGVKEGYKLLSKHYDDLFNIATISEEDYFYKLIGDVKDKKILDVGIGTGRYAIPLAKRGAHVYGIDFLEDMISIAKKKAEKENLTINFKIGNILDLPYPKSQFDIVICNLVASHVKDFKVLIKEIVRVCKSGGEIIFSTIHPDLIDNEKEEWAPFDLEDETLLIRRFKRDVSRYLEEFESNKVVFKKVVEIKLSKKVGKMNVKIFKEMENLNIILLIKAEKS